VSDIRYGGQAVIEGIMIRGARAMAIAVRHPDGSIATRGERLGGLHAGAVARIPLLRGVAVLWETLTLGARALTWSAAVAAGETDEHGDARPPGIGARVSLLFMLTAATAVFFVAPALVAVALASLMPGWAAVAVEGATRIALLLGYVWSIGRSEEVRRVFQYHGAEHMAIQAFEQRRELQVPAVRRFGRQHPRCGTSFLLTMAVVAIPVFIPLGGALWWRLAWRVALIPFVAAVAYEVVRLGAAHAGRAPVRWLFAGNLALQRLTTREPDDEQLQVAIAALERCVAEDRAAGVA
jgi:uncharacterized protein YqhQ